MQVRKIPLVTSILLLLFLASSVRADDDADFFEKKIRPLLVTKCFECHSETKSKGGLVLDSRENLLTGGDSGPALAPGKPDESLLIEAIGYESDIQMPPDGKLTAEEIADLTHWVKTGAVWPARKVSIPLGNLFDDGKDASLGDALVSDEFKAAADSGDLAIDRVLHGWGAITEFAPGLRIDLGRLGANSNQYELITNDAWSRNGGIRTQGKKIAPNADRDEAGIGMHANALVTFQLAELRAAGGLPEDQAFVFHVDRAGLNDDVFGGGPSAYVMAIVSRGTAENPEILAFHLNGQAFPVELKDGIFSPIGELPAPMTADGRFVRIEIPISGNAQYLTLVSTGGTTPADNTISSDHVVFSGARLEFATTSSQLARLGRTPEPPPFEVTAEQRAFWSFKPIADPAVPAVKNAAWPQNSIDYFVLSRLEADGLTPVALAQRAALLRRVTFDLTGLPPTPEEIAGFLGDSSEDAYAKVVDRLLASPHYGERWGRYWLDIARYAEDQAHTFQARTYPNGFRYRDWVVKSFNEDLPYDRFVMEQIAGDLLEGSGYDGLTALGYFALGPVYYADAGCAAKAAADELDDRVDTLGRGLLGLTISCARCHDHKFDPVGQQDYYSLAGIFSSSVYRLAPLVEEDVVNAFNQGQQAIKEQEGKVNQFIDAASTRLTKAQASDIARYINAVWKLQVGRKSNPKLTVKDLAQTEQVHEFLLERWVTFLKPEMKGKSPELTAWFELQEKLLTETDADEARLDELTSTAQEAAAAFQSHVQAIIKEEDTLQAEYAAKVAAAPEAEKKKIPQPKLDDAKSAFLKGLFGDKALLQIPKDKVAIVLDSAGQTELKSLQAELENRRKSAPPQFPQAHSLTEGQAANMRIYLRGNHEKPGPEAPRRFLTILSKSEPEPFTEGSGRLELARAIASPDNPLTARVMVNRVWQQHFGRGIVGTPSNFGLLGERPTHPALLDHLATQFIKSGWSLKALHRLILLSSTYQLSTDLNAQNFEADPGNHLLWRMNRRRLDVEAWRDSLLAVSGNLDQTLGGPSGNLSDANYARRTIYGKVSRHNLDGLLRLFDFPDPNITSERRSNTTVPLQQLFVLNSDFMVRQSKALAAALQSDPQESNESRIQRAFLRVFGRSPHTNELELGLAFLSAEPIMNEQNQPEMAQLTPWEQYAQVLLSANEFTYLD